MSVLFPGASGLIFNGGTFNATTNISQSKRGIDHLIDWVATDAFHNSKELYDAPKCHPHTRAAVLADIMKWVVESGTEDELIMWLFGPAGAGKSAIAKRIAELAEEKGLIIGSFFFSRTSSKRNTQDRLIPTLAYQMALSIPGTRSHIEHAIEADPVIFHKTIQIQIDTLLIKPFKSVTVSTQIIAFPNLLIIDGLDECTGSQAQVAILNAVSHSLTAHKLPIRFLIASRPEISLLTLFNGKEPLKSIHRRLTLDDNYHPYGDIHRFFSDKFEEIRCTHRLKSTIPESWPTEESLDTLVRKSSGQFIFAATVIKFVESHRHRPAERLKIVLGIYPPSSTINPFTELDMLYKQILSSADDIQLTLHVLSFYVSSSHLANRLGTMSDHFLSLEEGDIDRALIDLSSIVSYDGSSGKVNILHASFVDFLSDKRRSDEFYIDMESARTDFVCRTLQYVKGPNGLRAGDIDVLTVGIGMGGWILNGQLRDEILNFDLDAFITATIKSPYSTRSGGMTRIFSFWMNLIPKMGLEDRDKKLLRHRCRHSLEARIQKYQSDWRLQLLLTLTFFLDYSPPQVPCLPTSRRLDILLEMDDEVHRVDWNALDLRYSQAYFHLYTRELRDIISRYVDGDRYSSAALHCMRFLSNPPQYSETERNVSPQMGFTFTEWKETCDMALVLLYRLLKWANTSPEVIQILTDHDINTILQKNLPVIDIWQLDTHILAFLSRGGVCVNWRIISAIQQSLSATDKSNQSKSS